MKKKTIVAEEEEQPRTKPPVSVPITAPAETEVAHPAAEALTSEPPHRAVTVCQAFALDRDKTQNAEIEKLILEDIPATIAKHPIGQAYNLLFLYDERKIERGDANRIYRAVSEADGQKPTLLIVTSPGGSVAAAYFIAKLCREYTQVFRAPYPARRSPRPP